MDVEIDSSEVTTPPVIRVDQPEQAAVTQANISSAIDIPLDEPKEQKTTPVEEEAQEISVFSPEHSETAGRGCCICCKSSRKSHC